VRRMSRFIVPLLGPARSSATGIALPIIVPPIRNAMAGTGGTRPPKAAEVRSSRSAWLPELLPGSLSCVDMRDLA